MEYKYSEEACKFASKLFNVSDNPSLWNLAAAGFHDATTSATEETIRHAFNAGVMWSIGTGMDIDEYLEAQK